jgi:hypothetical protein
MLCENKCIWPYHCKSITSLKCKLFVLSLCNRPSNVVVKAKVSRSGRMVGKPSPIGRVRVVGYSEVSVAVKKRAFVWTNPTGELITSGFPVQP